ncbi:hypothetical protein Adt_39844 [Abeliophyllum distichum]|uniref:MSP domain-containing protein n=1 Tax=Abeliophyllum distichum TaxID=126358 RepID=A0ABD1Q678_9LAMI
MANSTRMLDPESPPKPPDMVISEDEQPLDTPCIIPTSLTPPKSEPTSQNQNQITAGTVASSTVLPERSVRKSFASILQASPDSTCHQFMAKEPYLHRGEPALVILLMRRPFLAEPFKFTLVGKFSHGKPKMVKVEDTLVNTIVTQASKPFVTPALRPTVAPTTKPVVVLTNKHVDTLVFIVDRAEKGKKKEVVVEVPRQWVPVASSSLVVAIPPLVVYVGPTCQPTPGIPTTVASKPFHDDGFSIHC